MEVNVGILAIGNEVVEGQITNRNAAWLSQELAKMGAQPLFHLSCRDQDNEIKSSLNYLSEHCNLVLVSGGLGPTSDDFTRKSLSQWTKAPLELNEDQWKIIKDKLEHRKLTLRNGHKNQAYIPRGATVLPNNNGIAPGFFIKTSTVYLASLPGPPSELHSMFNQALKPLIVDQLQPKNNKTLKTYLCLGAPESEIAHVTESIIANQYEIGFRLHRPYVEVKLWVPNALSKNDHQRLTLLESKLKPWLVSDSVQSIRKKFHEVIAQYQKIFIVDHLTQGLFLDKLKEDFQSPHIRYQCFESEAGHFFSKQQVQTIIQKMSLSSEQQMLCLFPCSEHSSIISYGETMEEIKLPRRISSNSKLGKLNVIEQLFLRIIENKN